MPDARSRRAEAWSGCLVLVLLAVTAACGGGAGVQTAPTPASVASTPASAASSGGWHLTVYYTPVESYHGGRADAITGCKGEVLGSHSHDFLDPIQTEGFGRLSAPVAGRGYLGWDFDRGCWLLAATPVGANDRPLRPWVSTAAHPSIAIGTRVSISGCGSRVDRAVCDRVRAAGWVVDDRCSVGCGDVKHLDLYIGEEDRPNFVNNNPNYFETRGAAVALSR